MAHYFYIPGLGERFNILRRPALRRWRNSGDEITLIPMRWNDKSESYEEKYERIIQVINKSDATDITVVGESAGGSLALLTFVRNSNRINRVITICGYNHGAANIHKSYQKRTPAFYKLLVDMESTILNISNDLSERISVIYSTGDTVVTPMHTRLANTKEVALRTPGHLTTIGIILLNGLRKYGLG